jgi:hypothetical protein
MLVTLVASSTASSRVESLSELAIALLSDDVETDSESGQLVVRLAGRREDEAKTID